jgi:hypothetical protein
MTASISVEVLTVDELRPVIADHFGSVRNFTSGPPPADPGVYVWSADRGVLYIGKAAALTQRIGYEASLISAHDPVSAWQVSVIHMLKVHSATVEWMTTTDLADAELLERRLIEWHRTCVGMAPLVVGWEAKPNSPRKAAELWAQELWRKRQQQ